MIRRPPRSTPFPTRRSSDLSTLGDKDIRRLDVAMNDSAAMRNIESIGNLDCPVNDRDRKSTRLNSSHLVISYAVFCLKKKKNYELYARVVYNTLVLLGVTML